MSQSIEQSEEYQIQGMSCSACAVSIQNAVKKLEGVNNIQVNYATHSLSINHQLKDKDLLFTTVKGLGYGIKSTDSSPLTAATLIQTDTTLRSKLIVALLLGGSIFVMGMFFMHWKLGHYISFVLCMPVLFYSGRQFYRSAFKKARHLVFTMDTLVALGTGIAFLYSSLQLFIPSIFQQQHFYFESAAVIIALVLVGKFLEERAKKNTAQAIESLYGLQAKNAWVQLNNQWREQPINTIQKGMIIRVTAGERIPLDGIIQEGKAEVDEAMLTGEFELQHKEKGHKVIGGTFNSSGTLIIKVENNGNEGVLSQIIQQVREAQNSRAPIQQLTDKVTQYFVPIVLLLSLITFLIWGLWVTTPDWIMALNNAIAVIVIACPCALGLATPMALMAGIGKGASQGILIKDARALQLLLKVTTIAFDKTGTLTEGKPKVLAEHWIDESSKEEHLLYAHAIASQSSHPLSKALAQHWSIKELAPPSIEVETIVGKGLRSNTPQGTYLMGGQAWMEELVYPLADLPAEFNQASLVYLADELDIIAVFALGDALKEESHKVVKELQGKGLELMLLSGDRPEAVATVANALNLQEWKGGLSPEQKRTIIINLQKEGKMVAMLGDGINDSPALSQADVGIAMSSGADVALKAADLTLLKGDLAKVAAAIQLSKHTMRNLKENLFWAFIYNLIGIPIAMGILYPLTGTLLNPMLAALAMTASSLFVVLNALRLKFIRL